MKKIFFHRVYFLVCFFVFSAFISFSQNFSTELRILDQNDGIIHAGLYIKGIEKQKCDQLSEKAGLLKLYSVNHEYHAEKKVGFINLVSISPATIIDFQNFLKQLEIFNVYYNGKLISSSEIAQNYVPLKKEIIDVKRN